jgi:hypothetical protein
MAMQRVKSTSVREGNQFKEYARQQAQQREDDIRLLKVRSMRVSGACLHGWVSQAVFSVESASVFVCVCDDGVG